MFRLKSTEEKYNSLEEADVFLQEAQRQITEKNSALETLMKTRWDKSISKAYNSVSLNYITDMRLSPLD